MRVFGKLISAALFISLVSYACKFGGDKGSTSVSKTASLQDQASTRALRGPMIHFLSDPSKTSPQTAVQYWEDGLLYVKEGKVQAAGPATELLSQLPSGIPLTVVGKDQLIIPGFIDTHIHMPQTEMVGAYGEQLLDWLKKYTFPTEKQFEKRSYAENKVDFFLRELLKNGTTTALVFATVHKESADVLFEKALALDMRIIAGKVLMDRNAPDYLLDTPVSGYEDSKELIDKWHNKGRLLYAITPRFAPTSTRDQLELAGKLKKEFPSTYVHTHVSENLGEIDWVKSLFPERSGYMDVYHHYGLTGSRSVFAHGVHLTDEELQLMAKTDSAISFCPTSNLFLGSGLFPLQKAKTFGVKVGLGTDIGAGTSFSHFETLGEAYKIQQLQSKKLSAFEGFYLATLGGAKSLELEDKIGNFLPGKEADFLVVNLAATELGRLRLERAQDIEDKLFALMTLGDDRNIAETYVAGRLVYKAE
jgi:guanine deaminase